jgi:hypothetical protein
MAAGLAMATSFGLTGTGPGAASAATPALHIVDGSTWTVVVNGGGCQLDIFSAAGHFHSPEIGFSGDAGTWSGGGSTLKMVWKKGQDMGLTFKGTFTKTPVKEYVGQLNGPSGAFTGQVEKGAVAGC